MWKAFVELEEIGLVGPRQAEGCAPIVRAFRAGERFAEPWENARTRASGTRVPFAVGDFLILDALRDSGGTAVAVDEGSIADMQASAGRMGAGYVGQESALAAVPELRERVEISRDEEVVVFDCGVGHKYPPLRGSRIHRPWTLRLRPGVVDGADTLLLRPPNARPAPNPAERRARRPAS